MRGMCTAPSFCLATSVGGEKRRERKGEERPGGVERLDEEGPMTVKIKLADWGQEERTRGQGRKEGACAVQQPKQHSDNKRQETRRNKASKHQRGVGAATLKSEPSYYSMYTLHRSILGHGHTGRSFNDRGVRPAHNVAD